MFLGGGVLFYGLGAAFAHADGASIDWAAYLLGQALVTSVQLATQYANEYFDLGADRANQRRTWLSGGSGVLADGRLAPEVAERAALLASAVSLAIGTWLIFVEPAATALGAVALLGGWYYSAPPARLVASGWGELTASLIVVGMTPVTGSVIVSGSVGSALWWAILGLVPLHVAMLLALHLPDRAGDAAAGKRTLVVRIGSRASHLVLPALLVVGFGVIGWAGATSRLVGSAGWGLVGALPAAGLATLVVAGSERWAAITTLGVATVSVTGAGLLLGALA